jgi:hypothetical protein
MYIHAYVYIYTYAYMYIFEVLKYIYCYIYTYTCVYVYIWGTDADIHIQTSICGHDVLIYMKPGYIHIIYKIPIYVYICMPTWGGPSIFVIFFLIFLFSLFFSLKGAHESTGRRLQSGVPLGALVGEEGERGGQEDDVSEGGVTYVYIRMYIYVCVCMYVYLYIYIYIYLYLYLYL